MKLFIQACLFVVLFLIKNQSFALDAIKIPLYNVTTVLLLDKKIIATCPTNKFDEHTCDIHDIPAHMEEPKHVVAGNFIPFSRASWMLFGNEEISLCALPITSKDIVCKKLKRSNFSIQYPPKYLPALNLLQICVANHKGMLTSSFSNELFEAQKSLHTEIISQFSSVAKPELPRAVDIEEKECKQNWGPLDDDDDLGGGGIGGGDLGGGGNLPPYDNSGSSGGIEAGRNLACVMQCEAAYASESNLCRIIPEPRSRALCWAAISTVLGACLASC